MNNIIEKEIKWMEKLIDATESGDIGWAKDEGYSDYLDRYLADYKGYELTIRECNFGSISFEVKKGGRDVWYANTTTTNALASQLFKTINAQQEGLDDLFG